MVDATPIAELAKSGSQLVDGGVQCGRLVDCGSLGSHGRSAGTQRHLDSGSPVVLTRIGLVRYLDLNPLDLLTLLKFVNALEFFDDLLTEPIGDLAVPALDDNFHPASRNSLDRYLRR
jgi:hypothetical protein